MVFYRGFAEPKGSIIANQRFRRWPVKSRNNGQNLQLQCYTHTPVSTDVFSCVTKYRYRKIMFLFIWNRTNAGLTAWGSASNLNAPKGSEYKFTINSIPFHSNKKVEKHRLRLRRMSRQRAVVPYCKTAADQLGLLAVNQPVIKHEMDRKTR